MFNLFNHSTMIICSLFLLIGRGVFFSLLFGPILILICMVMFTASGTGTLSCEPLASLQIFEKVCQVIVFFIHFLLFEVLKGACTDVGHNVHRFT